MPRRAAVAGKLASLQMLGMMFAKGLVFFSAATRAIAAAMTAGSSPSWATMVSARLSCSDVSSLSLLLDPKGYLTLAQALAPARRTPGVWPARVPAWPGWPKSPRPWTRFWIKPSCPKRASAAANRVATTASLVYMLMVGCFVSTEKSVEYVK